MPTNLFQRVGDFFEQRKAYRAQALTNLRKRENLPQPVDENGCPLETRFDDFGNVTYHNPKGTQATKVLFMGVGKDGKPGSFAIGSRKGPSLDEASQNWDNPFAQSEADGGFPILPIAEDGRRLVDELLDLNRDAGTYEMAERVHHGDASEQAPGFELDGTSDEEVLKRLTEHFERRNRI